MYRIYLVVYIILMLVFGYWASDAFRQERAKLKYSNPKYIRDVVVFTGRKSRHDPYLTNMTGTIMMPFGNNVSDAFRQERAKLKYSNPKYIRDVVVFTGRKSRHDPYLTNMTGTIMMPFGNNVSFATTLTLRSGGDFRIVSKVCDTIKAKWMNEFMSSFTNLSLAKCPFPPARYTYINMELPPKNIPIPIADGDYFIKFELFVTATKESILEIDTLLHFDQNARRAKGKGKKG